MLPGPFPLGNLPVLDNWMALFSSPAPSRAFYLKYFNLSGNSSLASRLLTKILVFGLTRIASILQK